MKNKKKIVTLALAGTMCVSAALGLVACGPKKVNVNAKEVYATAAVSSVEYLKKDKQPAAELNYSTMDLLSVGSIRPYLADDALKTELKSINNCVNMFSAILKGNGVTQTTDKNTDYDETLTEGVNSYPFKMSVNLPTLSGGKDVFTMYYKEVATETETEIEDETEEVEVSTTLEGIMVYGEGELAQEFPVEGERNFETEGDESESTITFKTYLDKEKGDYVEVTQEVENNEIEYEYIIYENGKKVQITEVEIENEDGKTELEFEFKDKRGDTTLKTVYKLSSTAKPNTFDILARNPDKTTKEMSVVLGENANTYTVDEATYIIDANGLFAE